MRCLIVDDHMVLSAGLSMLIKTEFPDWNIEFASTVKMAIELLGVNSAPPIDMIFVDMILPNESGLSLLQHVQSAGLINPVKTLVISGLTDASKVEACRSLGADGYLSKSDAHEHVLDAIKTILDGGTYFGNADSPSQPVSNSFSDLPERYRDVLDLLMNGSANKAIGFDLGLSHGTVKNYVHAIMRTVGVTSRTNMLLKAQQAGYVPRSPEDVIKGKKREL